MTQMRVLKKMKNFFNKFWKFYWKDTSFQSYVFFIIFTYLVFKFVFYPAFLYIFGLKDIVSILSGSMTHHGDFTQWYLEHGFTLEEINSWPFQKGFNIGDAVVIKSVENISELKVGDVVVFDAGLDEPIIHRIIELNNKTFTTHGDNNYGLLPQEENVSYNKLIGKAVMKLPLAGIPRMLMKNIFGL